MDPIEDQHLARQRADALLVWAATGGALVSAVLIFLATSSPAPEPVAEPMPSTDWQLPVTTSLPSASTTFAALAPAPTSTATTPPLHVTITTTAAPPRPTTSPPSTKELRAVGAGKCLDVPNSTDSPGQQVQIYTCNGQPNQAWAQTSSGQLTVTLGGTTLCLDAYGQRTSPGTKVITWPCNGQDNERWAVNSDGTITGVQSGLCLDVTDAATANGALAELWSCNGGSNQQWLLH